MIVLDASAAINGLLADGQARRALAAGGLHAPHLVDFETVSAIRRIVRAGQLPAGAGQSALAAWRRLVVVRYSAASLTPRIWSLRENLTAYDAAYVALAEALQCPLVTADSRLANAAGIRCPVTVLPD